MRIKKLTASLAGLFKKGLSAIFAVLQHYTGRVIILIPMVLLLLYLVIFSQPRYLSESKVAIKRASDIDNASLNIGLLMGASNPSSSEDALYLKEYLHSPDMLSTLDKQLDFKKAFGESGLDFFYHLSRNATAEEFLDYYRHRITINFNNKNGLLTIQTQGFTPEFALRFNQAALKEAERFINELSHRIARDQQRFSEEELARASERLNRSKGALLAYQNSNNVLDPQATALAANTLVNNLTEQKIKLETELRNLLTYLREDAPQVVTAKNALASVEAQIAKEQRNITAPEGDKLNRMAADFDELKSKVAFDTDLYRLALTAIEKTRVEAARKLKSLSVISSPQLPQQSRFPDVPWLLASWLLVCGLLYGTLKLLLSIVDDHRN
ncbi:capsule biosynthesis protein [Franconibacter pulveris]|uniref:Capsule biosynthesis protein n=3 Tax=Enterobacteriaceae TaxID=543 RepID=A0A0J8VQI7_9ENTR|nr:MULTISPECIES: capsule biosynthesis protein [Franconibacter]KMV35197.1 capsule biosynthesis protein [Franconibacter pulveris]